jgi:hypothetical protein
MRLVYRLLKQPCPAIDGYSQVVGIDVLGPRLRVLSASVVVALAFSEALSKRRA